MNESGERFGFEDRRLSIIDVSFEDDSLYASPPCDRQIHRISDNQTAQKSVEFSGAHAENARASADPFEGEEEKVRQPLESLEPEGKRRNQKYNLRKSLAWDSAFFTSAGVLEPEELSTMIGGAEKGGKHMLPGIEEEIHRSSDSISTFASDSLTIETLEADLFGDIRASIQRSSEGSNVSDSNSLERSGTKEKKSIQSGGKVAASSRKKLEAKAAPKKPNVVMQGTRKATKQAAAPNEDLTSFSKKPPKAVGRVSTVSTTGTKRASLGTNLVKLERGNVKVSTGRSMKTPASGSTGISVPRPTQPLKSFSSSTKANKTELITPASSVDSSGSLSSESSDSSNATKSKNNSRAGKIHPCSGSTVNNTRKTSSINSTRSVNSNLSPRMRSVNKLSSGTSPASSVSEWSIGSLSPTSTLNKRSDNSRPSFNTKSCDNVSGDGVIPQALDSQTYSHDKGSSEPATLGSLDEAVKSTSMGTNANLHPSCIQQTGLRMPSPKIGFFDGVRSVARTSTGSTQSHPAVPGALPRLGTASVSPDGGSHEAKIGKGQTATSRTVIAVQRSRSAQQPAGSVKPKSPLLSQGIPNTTPEVHRAPRSAKRCVGTSLKSRNRISLENDGKSHFMAEKVVPMGSSMATDSPGIGIPARYVSSSALKEKINPAMESNDPIKDTEITTAGVPHSAVSPSSILEVKDLSLSQKRGGDDSICGYNHIKHNLHSPCQGTCFQGQVDEVTHHLGTLDIHEESKIATASDSLSLQLNVCRDVNFNGQEEFMKLSKPTTLNPTTESTAIEENRENGEELKL